MSSARLRVVVVIASIRAARLAPTIAHWFTGEANQRDDLELDVLDLADHPLPLAMDAEPAPDTVAVLDTVTPRLEQADAYVVLTPEYNHSFPAALKNLIDWHYTPWRGKPVAFVSYGGLSGGLRAVEQLRQVFAEMHAVTIRDTVSFHNANLRFDQDGAPTDPDGCNAAVKIMLDQLVWWASALRTARTAQPYHV